MTDRLEQLHRLLATDPNDAFCLYAMGMEYARRGEHEAAAAHLQQSLASEPDQPYAHFHRARSLAHLRQFKEADAAVDAGLDVAQSQGDEKAAEELAELRSTWVQRD
ncbi:MAG: tetratricopeptide repeat protein [Phycisphaerales bacterium]|jgi:tetratricopeptide (TPR) repeat protein|nr:tetratricopeptide repeat protein [Phycisphaerales bacterium]MDP6891418.1 tetratricopeptide repeat protein [Phycisphaerales bacterium]